MHNLAWEELHTDLKVPMVELFETVEGEGRMAGYPTVFIRIFHCNLRCTWCDTTYSYAPEKPAFTASICEIVDRVSAYGHGVVCLTGGEPLMHGVKSLALVYHLARIPHVWDIHIETNGAIDLQPFQALREREKEVREKVRFVMDYKLPASGETERMHVPNLALLEERDEVKFVVGNEADFMYALDVLKRHPTRATALFSPVWETMPPADLVSFLLKYRPQEGRARLNMQIHKVIWDPEARGV
ncbi:radical SAM protein [Aneurinibacillus thermoaerophilus]|jgi:7-carboxy-7-deazaguanine synthase|uniref:7-carboxy-7-deazaguanine synthase n=2 Tax=Aneurinibacillus thermoaerophilus TaxID=143495 RepID=A0A1G7WYH3_ANETH|nr:MULTISPECIES: radical SAM protein [Aneurinibacillus]AMA73881.1 radical SAM protein [Aneurinibacillus sp. XH2]MED0674062.1 radical SAM protein [Aneurinibacillus thermoaerophilus]MED0678047.1 radical SAM protein [Aneurinibacillus thermoaerophilus]MED0737763.1 radical SAM protein [Aneurinibacillus thermoaerophilus]MED0755749.1 radical SAM protein [Aneurinibacillus thermoaerophilus]